mmetsp:Transcript_320/g.899  ORF Transcript_320/g.899 Transcript_320/m.899 type:complete len:219 (-) Transcript_320:20-676(-)
MRLRPTTETTARASLCRCEGGVACEGAQQLASEFELARGQPDSPGLSARAAAPWLIAGLCTQGSEDTGLPCVLNRTVGRVRAQEGLGAHQVSSELEGRILGILRSARLAGGCRGWREAAEQPLSLHARIVVRALRRGRCVAPQQLGVEVVRRGGHWRGRRGCGSGEQPSAMGPRVRRAGETAEHERGECELVGKREAADKHQPLPGVPGRVAVPVEQQ